MAKTEAIATVAGGDRSAATQAAWMQLGLGFLVMMTISSPQYVWTLFVPSFQTTTGAILSEVQWTITLLIVLQTWLSPLQGFFVEKLGPKILIGLRAAVSGAVAQRESAPRQMLKTPVFWLMFAMMSMMSTGGLMVITQFTSFAKAFGIDGNTSVIILGVTMAAIPTALTFDRITNGLTRPFFGWVSDHIGRENTMGIAFILEGIAITLMLQYRADPFMLIVLSGLVFFGWGEIFSLFPSTLTDTFGTRYATTNYGFLYMAQGIGSILGAPVAAMVFERTGSWMPVFGLVIAMDVLTGLLALFVLTPMRGRLLARSAA